MSELFWLVTLGFLLTGVIGAFRRKNGTLFGWFLIAFFCLSDTFIGVMRLLTRGDVFLGNWGQIFPLGLWTWKLDWLGAFFLAISGVIGLIVAVYNTGYAARNNNGFGLWALIAVAEQYFFTNILLVAYNALPMLIAWEGMSITAFCYVLTNHSKINARKAAYVTIVASEIGFLTLVIALLMLGQKDWSMNFKDLVKTFGSCSSGIRLSVMILMVIGFGVKSGFLPVQFWLPRAYKVVPGNLGALLAGSLVNLGIFGILRFNLEWLKLIPDEIAIILIMVGSIGVFLGALYAATLHNLKRILGYSSIENSSFMILDIGLIIIFYNHGQSMFAGLAFLALLTLIVSHGLAKALAFLSVGEIEKMMGTTNLDSLGGIQRQMPLIGKTFLIACLSLAGVAPFSGFTAEWLGIQSLFQTYHGLYGMEKLACIIAVVLLAIGSALAFTAFLRAYIYTFTGINRPDSKLKPEKIPKIKLPVAARISLIGLAGLCTLVGFVPTVLVSILSPMVDGYFKGLKVIGNIVPNVFRNYLPSDLLPKLGGRLFSRLPMPGAVIQPPADGIASIAPTYLLFWFIFFAVLAWIITIILRRPYSSRTVKTWLGGNTYYGPDSQYSATAYGNTYRMLFSSLINFKTVKHVQNGLKESPKRIEVQAVTKQILSMSPYERILRSIRKKLRFAVRIQHGHLSGYMAYILIFTLLLLLTVSLWD